jgi:hypothetical protein
MYPWMLAAKLGLAAKLSDDIGNGLVYGIEVFRINFVVFHADGETFLKKDNQFDDALGIDHLVHKRRVVVKLIVAPKEEGVYEKGSDFALDVGFLHG